MVTAGHGKRNVSVIMIHITYLSVHIMKWFDAMCEEPFDAVAKVVVCVSEYDETNDLTQCVKKHFWSGKKPFFIRNECGAASVCLSENNQLLTNCHITGAQLPTRMSCLCICVCVPSFLSVRHSPWCVASIAK